MDEMESLRQSEKSTKGKKGVSEDGKSSSKIVYRNP